MALTYEFDAEAVCTFARALYLQREGRALPMHHVDPATTLHDAEVYLRAEAQYMKDAAAAQKRAGAPAPKAAPVQTGNATGITGAPIAELETMLAGVTSTEERQRLTMEFLLAKQQIEAAGKETVPTEIFDASGRRIPMDGAGR